MTQVSLSVCIYNVNTSFPDAGETFCATRHVLGGLFQTFEGMRNADLPGDAVHWRSR